MSASPTLDVQDALNEFIDAERDLHVELEQIIGDLSGLVESAVTTIASAMSPASSASESALPGLELRLMEGLQRECSKLESGWQQSFAERLEDLHAQWQSTQADSNEAESFQRLKVEHAALEAELRMAKARTAELYRTTQAQQQLLERGRDLDAEVARLRASVETNNRLMQTRVGEAAETDPVLREALEALDRAAELATAVADGQ